ncbi:nuclear nucleic acid-binding protein C1D-like [Lytechinus pictus]|uniref:nuclear nucleic acid-binding protein C1D-like n=1 Tax=Lytechinus pictus TaxID=7653 RepID=UPI0030BA0A3A
MAVPKEIAQNLDDFKAALNEVEDVFKPINSVSLADINGKLDALDRAKLQLVFAYSINSFFWMYLCTQGVDARSHQVKQELGRIQKYMARVKEIADKKKAAKLDTGAAKRFIRNALWENESGEGQSQTTKRKGQNEPAGPSKKSR